MRPLGGQQEQHPGRDTDRAGPLAPGPEAELLGKLRHVAGQLPGGGFAARREGGQGAAFDVGQPAGGVAGDPDATPRIESESLIAETVPCALFTQQPHQPAPFGRRQAPRAGGVDHRRQVGRHHEQGAPHTQHPDQGARAVEGVLQMHNLETAHPRARRQVDRRRIAGVESHQAGGHRLHGAGRHGQMVAPRQPRAPLCNIDPPAHSHSVMGRLKTLANTPTCITLSPQPVLPRLRRPRAAHQLARQRAGHLVVLQHHLSRAQGGRITLRPLHEAPGVLGQVVHHVGSR